MRTVADDLLTETFEQCEAMLPLLVVSEPRKAKDVGKDGISASVVGFRKQGVDSAAKSDGRFTPYHTRGAKWLF